MSQFAKSLSNVMTPLYVEKFQLAFAPFSERYSESLYFEEESRQEILKKITHLTDYTNLVLFIQGAEGLGKTSLLKHRLNTEKSNWRVCYFNARDYVTSESFIEKLFTDFNLKFSENIYTAQAQSLHEQIDSLRQTGLTPVMIIDNVDEINKKIIPVLQSLINFSADNQPIVRLIVAGEDIPESLLQIIPIENDRQAIKFLPVPPLSEKQTTAYIRFRLNQAGYNAIEPFNKQNVKNIYLDSKGFPKYINHLSDHLMNQFMQSSGDKIHPMAMTDNSSKKLKIAVFALASIVFVTLLFVIFENDSDKIEQVELDENIKQLQIPSAGQTEIKQPPALETEIQTMKSIPQVDMSDKESVINQTPLQSSEKILPNIAETTTPMKKESDIVVEQVDPPVPSKPKATTIAITASKEKRWINQQNPNHYTLQLIGSSNKKAAINFIKKHNIEKNAVYFRTTRKGNDWYAVIYQSYPDIKKARDNAKKLPESLRKFKPWIRPFKDIQKAAK